MKRHDAMLRVNKDRAADLEKIHKNSVKSGTKRIELRLFDEKRQD